MKDIRKALRAFLLADAAIAALVVDRVFAERIPQGKAGSGCIVHSLISGQGDYHMLGPSGLVGPRYQLAAWAPTIDAAVVIANLIKDRVDGYKGVMGSGGNAVTVQGVFCAGEQDSYDGAALLNCRSRDYFLHHEEL